MTNLWFVNESARPLVYALCRLRRPSVPALRTACARASSRFAAFNGQRPGRECIFPFRTVPQFSMVVPLRSQARLWHSLLHWAYSALFRAQRARFVRPSPSAARCSVSSHRPALRLRGVPALRPPFGRVLAPPAASRPSIAHYASLRVLGTSALRAFDGQRPGRERIFTHSSQSSIHIARKACLWLLLLTGLTSACFVPQFAIVALLRCRLQVSFAHWTSASPVSRTARGEAPSHRRRPPCAPQKIPEMTYTPSFLI